MKKKKKINQVEDALALILDSFYYTENNPGNQARHLCAGY
jgi:hypothetical protein